jgi:hypothetical protein
VINLSDGLRKRGTEILHTANQVTGAEAAQFAVTMLTNFYGPQSPQLTEFRDGCDAIRKKATYATLIDEPVKDLALGTIKNILMELEAGLIVSVRTAVTGEVLAELLGLAKEILNEKSDTSKNVCAVLVAAAYEDMIRRMGQEFASITSRPSLQEVITALKEQNVLKGGETGTAQSYLKFRNDSLHADWENVSRSQVESCLAFVESLLLKHFGG